MNKNLFEWSGRSVADGHHISPIRNERLLEVYPGLLCQFECNNAGGSHKARAARWVIAEGLAAGQIVPGQTVILEKTGGNFGVGLALSCREYNLKIELAVGLKFNLQRRRYLQFLGAELIGLKELEAGATPRQVVEMRLADAHARGEKIFFTDQFNNTAALRAHELETGPELAKQLLAYEVIKRVTFVGCAGTGASFTGISRALRKSGVSVRSILVEPLGCNSRSGDFIDHSLEGMAVGVVPPFLDWNEVDDVMHVSDADASMAQLMLCKNAGFLVGNTSAACFQAASDFVTPNDPSHKVVVVIYDHGLWYLENLSAASGLHK